MRGNQKMNNYSANVYNPTDGLNYIFQTRWKAVHSPEYNANRKEFPDGKEDLLRLYHDFEEKMNEKWHKNVNLGAAAAGGQLLTDHGVKHVKSVICHAGEIISDVNRLTGYEIFLLLMSIHFHDVGNISGREGHERKIAEIIEKMGNELPLDSAEKLFIMSIATAHGGYADKSVNDKDTIKWVLDEKQYAGVEINLKALAAILRYADEISDDLNRAEFDNIDIPKENEAYHEYSKALVPISIKGDTINLNFRIPYRLTQVEVGKEDCISI